LYGKVKINLANQVCGRGKKIHGSDRANGRKFQERTYRFSI